MGPNLGSIQTKQPGLTQFDRECIGRLLKAGQPETAAKIYRWACHCSTKEAERAISELSTNRANAAEGEGG